MGDELQIQSTRDYDKFSLIQANRETNKGHIEHIKKAFEEYGNLTKVQPILVNERFEIIDGQHRFLAAKDLGEPIFYTIQRGLGVAEARSMNILHRSWNMDDYARSYSESGDINYTKYMQLKKDYGFSHGIILLYVRGYRDDKGAWQEFRNGDFTMTSEKEARERLDKLADTGLIVPFVNDRGFGRAMLKAMKVEGYDHDRMLRKLELHTNKLERKSTVEDYLRLLEEIYNLQVSEGNRLRLY